MKNTNTQRTLHALREMCDSSEIAVRAELAKNGIPYEPEGNERSQIAAHRADLRRVVNGLRDKLYAVTQEKPFGAKQEQQYSALTKLTDALTAHVDICNIQLEMSDIGADNQGNKSSSWNNSRGSTIRVLGKNDRFSADLAFQSSNSRVGFGEYVSAMVTGTSRPEVRNALQEGTDSAGGYTVPKHLMWQVIDAMRAKTAAVQAGALTIPLETEKTTIARLDNDPQAGWRLELGEVANGNPTFGAVTFTARSLACLVKVSRELLEDSINIDSALMAAFAGAMAGELDRVALFGGGVAPEPRGVYNTSGISVVSMGTNGAALTGYGKMLDAIYEMDNANSGAPSAWVMSPRSSRVINGLVDTTGQPLNAPAAVSQIPRLVTTTVPTDQVHGSASNASSILLGDFSQLLIGVRSELRIEVMREMFAGTMEYAFLAHLRADIAVAQPKAFVAIKGVIP